MFSSLWSEIRIFIKILEKWGQDFRMVISLSKTKVVTPDKNLLWRILNLESGRYEEVERLQEFKYLGILQKYGVNSTMVCNAANKIEKARLYQRNILRMRRLIPDRIEVYLAMWNNVAIPSIIYGLEAIPFDKKQKDDLEAIQIALGKSILGVRHSMPGLVIYTELDLKPIDLLFLIIIFNMRGCMILDFSRKNTNIRFTPNLRLPSQFLRSKYKKLTSLDNHLRLNSILRLK